jgi:transposase
MLQLSRNPFANLPDRIQPRSRPYATPVELQYPIPECSHVLVLRENEMPLFWLDDALWRAIAPVLPSRQSGPKRNDDRTIVSGIMHVLMTGCAWRDCPREYGPYMTVFNRFNRWKHRGDRRRCGNFSAAAGTAGKGAGIHRDVLAPRQTDCE